MNDYFFSIKEKKKADTTFNFDRKQQTYGLTMEEDSKNKLLVRFINGQLCKSLITKGQTVAGTKTRSLLLARLFR